MKKKRLQQTMQKCKGYKRLMNNYMTVEERKKGRNGQILRKVQSFKTEPGRNRNYEQPNCKH